MRCKTSGKWTSPQSSAGVGAPDSLGDFATGVDDTGLDLMRVGPGVAEVVVHTKQLDTAET